MGIADWLNYGISNGYYSTKVPGVNDSPHFAVDIATPFHTPITVLWSGKVITVQLHQAWGSTLVIQPANGMKYMYLHLDVIYVSVGDIVMQGQVVGLSGGQNVGGQNPSTIAESSGPHTHIQYYTGSKNGLFYGPDITAAINTFMAGGFPIPLSSTGNSFLSGMSSSFTNVSDGTHEILNNIPGFQGLVDAVDKAEQFQPFQIDTSGGDIFGFHIPIISDVINAPKLPSETINAVIVFIMWNTMAVTVRLIIIFIGLAIILALIKNAMTEVTTATTGQTPGQLAATGIKLAALAA